MLVCVEVDEWVLLVLVVLRVAGRAARVYYRGQNLLTVFLMIPILIILKNTHKKPPSPIIKAPILQVQDTHSEAQRFLVLEVSVDVVFVAEDDVLLVTVIDVEEALVAQ